eukprot:TRINITY_DN7806_c1_g3_i1.p1 TRINITY_DN7806_c1_g3~~TRINITY_DN7806_c1_g3_i1.p1  ORF type:complete len:368 (+),score=94.34 TRINITY_DN7806_c1_g3_i1:93-1106(+)
MIGPRHSAARPRGGVFASSGGGAGAAAASSSSTSALVSRRRAAAAADEDEDEEPKRRGGSASADAGAKSSSAGASGSGGGGGAGSSSGGTQRKEKRYAWMDSDDSGNESNGSSHERSRSPARGNSSKKSGADADEEDGLPPLPASAAGVRSFSEMVRMAPELQRKAHRMKTAELSDVCAAAARVKFYDRDLLEAVTAQLRQRLRSRDDGLGPETLILVLSSLADLNAYDQRLFASAAKTLEASIDRLDTDQTCQLLNSFRAVKHAGDEEFVSALQLKAKNERYETAKNELWKRHISSMYGDNLDLQGSPMDAERALLKKPRHFTVRTSKQVGPAFPS